MIEDWCEAKQSPLIVLEGERVKLGPLRRDLIPLYARWRNDPKIMLPLSGQVRPQTLEEVTIWFDKAVQAADTDVRFLIYARNDIPVGVVQLTGIDRHNRTAGFGLWIGYPSLWGKGIGFEATCLMLRYGLVTLGLHSICLAVAADNERAIKLYTRAGFRLIGRQREVAYRDGSRVDMLLMDVLHSDLLSGADQ